MTEEERKEQPSGLSRREFLKDAGLVVGGTAVGSMAFLSSCKTGTVETITKTVSTTVTSPPVTTTVTAAAATKWVDPIDGTEWPTQAAMTAHFKAAHPNIDAAESMTVFTVNGVGYGFLLQPNWSLAHVLRDKLGLFALKEGCQLGECGCCAVMVDGLSVYSCLAFANEMGGKNVVTVEGLSNNGELDKVQQKFYDQDVTQCGFCTPGFLMAAEALYKVTPKPTLDEVREAVAGHVCMCGNVHRSVNAIVGGV
jgi:aerobic-type carbon monoxide dehydrogenase small subunit (CoxS/CutS family)